MSQDTTKKKPIDPEIVRPDGAEDDDVIHVPKGASKTRFIMTFLVVILVLTTFTVGPEVLDVLGGRDRSSKAFMTWKSPDGLVKSVSEKSFLEHKRSIATVLRWAFPGADRDPSDEQTASFIAIDQSAAEAGIVISDDEVAKFIREVFQTTDNYRGYCQSYRISTKDFEGMIRRTLRVDRYRDLLAQSYSIPDPAAIEKAWKGRHQEFMYDYVELPVATLVEEARAQAPQGEALKAWFDALSDVEKDAYKLKPEVSAEVVGISLDGPFSGDAILAKFPRPADANLEAEALQYHTDFGYARFPKQPTRESPTFAQPFESVKEQALMEAPIYHGLKTWVDGLLARQTAGETIDLAAEASELGLLYRKQADVRNFDAWKEMNISFVGKRTLEVIFDMDKPAGQLWPALSVDEKSFAYGRILESKPPRMPEFSEIEASVASVWADKEAKKIALARLESIRDAFGTRPDPADPMALPFQPQADEAKFAEAVTAAGLTVKRRDWRERMAPAPADEPPGEAYIRSNVGLTTMKENTVAKPEISRDGTTAYLVRVGGVRDPDLSKMKVDEFKQAAEQQVFQEQLTFIRLKIGSREFLESRFGVDLRSWHPEQSPAN
ncbi:MAG: hypothetical protein JNL28_17460 [Planctomycetes bacterium]|nr:hypothetical protein [Planctomycetota bacterium]